MHHLLETNNVEEDWTGFDCSVILPAIVFVHLKVLSDSLCLLTQCFTLDCYKEFMLSKPI